MKGRNILQRYERADDGVFLLDVAVNGVEDLFENFDRTAHYLRKDLNDDLVEYLIGCARELDASLFRIRIGLHRPPSEAQRERVRDSIRHYFSYRIEAERDDIRRLFRRSMLLLASGLVLMLLAYFVREYEQAGGGVLAALFAEGLTVAAWVSLWQVMAYLLMDWHPHRRMIRLFRCLRDAAVEFRQLDTSVFFRMPDHPPAAGEMPA